MNVHQGPTPVGRLAVNLRLAAFRNRFRTVFPCLGLEVPEKFHPGGITVNMDRYFARCQLALGEQATHLLLIHLALDLRPSVSLTQGVYERSVRRIGPDLRRECGIRRFNGLHISQDHSTDRIVLRP